MPRSKTEKETCKLVIVLKNLHINAQQNQAFREVTWNSSSLTHDISAAKLATIMANTTHIAPAILYQIQFEF